MSRSALTSWYASPFTGLFRRWGPVPRRPHDPFLSAWSGVLPRWGADGTDLAVGGIGLDPVSAEAAALGEAIERWQSRPLPVDRLIEASFACWPLDEPAVDPAHWVLYHHEQYALPGFPFAPFDAESVCRWTCCRVAGSGEACWAPAWQVFLAADHRFGPSLSTGLSAGRIGDPVHLRGLQEVIERDALMGAWWGRYPLEEYDAEGVFRQLSSDLPDRLVRPNLCYRCYRVRTPLSAHVSVVTLAGEDHEGYCFSAGSACREDRAASWTKAIFEAVQGRHYVRYLKATAAQGGTAGIVDGVPIDFAGHALYYSLHPDRLRLTVLDRPDRCEDDESHAREGWPALVERLGHRQVLFRLLTPPAAAAEGWIVLRVLVPGLQPLHGHHHYPFLGGSLWSPRGIDDYASMSPHPFP
jgi:ribosomal protein S12 methylthiotransferase accessory factor